MELILIHLNSVLVQVWGSNTYGFYLDFTGANLISYPPSVTGPTTGNEKFASVPPVSGVGTIEYGDWDDTQSDLLSGTGNTDCILTTFTFDAPLTEVVFGGFQPGLSCGGTNDPKVITPTSCFPSLYTYNVELSTKNCNGQSATWDIQNLDGNTIGSGSLAQNGLTETFNICGECGAEFNIDVPTGGGPAGCDGNLDPDVNVYDAEGTLLGTRTNSGSLSLDCVLLPVEIDKSNVSYNEYKRANLISWSTFSEQNNDYFTVLHSNDGINWEVIEKPSGAGNSAVRIEYESYHINFENNSINYYKIFQTDYNGRTETVALLSIDNSFEKELIKTLNFIGQEVGDNYKGVLIHYYSDGSTMKVYSK